MDNRVGQPYCVTTLMVRRRVSAVSNHEARDYGLILRDACSASSSGWGGEARGWSWLWRS